VCGETGVVWNTRDVARVLAVVCAKPGFVQPGLAHGFAGRMSGGPVLHVDASQAPPTEKLARAHFGADLLTLDASKVSTVRGIGCLVAPRAVPLAPLYAGGGQERGMRPGSEAPALAEAFAAGLARAVEGREAFAASARDRRAALLAQLAARIPDLLVNEGPHQAPHILNVSLPGRDTDYLVALLDEAGFAVSTKSACETDSGEGSRAVAALFGDARRAASTLRISWGRDTREGDLARFADALARAAAFIDDGPRT
jgi:cysteine desulfurase